MKGAMVKRWCVDGAAYRLLMRKMPVFAIICPDIYDIKYIFNKKMIFDFFVLV